MEILNNGNQNQNDSQAQQPQGQSKSASATIGSWNFHQKNLGNHGISAGDGGEYFTKFRETLTKALGDIAEGIEIKVVSLNRQNYQQLKFSALVVAARVPDVNANAVAFHTLILEGTGVRLEAADRQVDNRVIKQRRVTSDAWDSVLYKLAYDAVSENYPNSHVYSGEAEVVPNKVLADQKDVIDNIGRNAAMACVSVINKATDNFGELNLTQMDRSCRLSIDVAIGNHQVYDVLGQPHRSSVLITYNSQMKNANEANRDDFTVNTPDSVQRICELSGFLNAIWAPVEPQGGYGFQAVQDPRFPRKSEKFAAEFVVTNVRTDFATSPAAVLLALSSSFVLVDGDTWLQGFIPRQEAIRADKRSETSDITDIGALNITGNLGGSVDDPRGFGPALDIATFKGDITKINKYLVSLFRPGLIVSVDCPETGATSWFLSAFAAAAGGDQAAYNEIYNAAQELTGGMFEQHFKHGQQMFSNITRVPLGFYRLGDTLRDIRDIDYTAMANIFANNPMQIHAYSDTFVDRPGCGSIQNLSIRENLLSEALNGQIDITSYAARVSLSMDFITALSMSIAGTKLPVTVNTPLSADMLCTGTAAPNFIGQALARGTQTYGAGYAQALRHQPHQQYRYGSFARR